MNSVTPFTDDALVRRYADDTAQRVPGFSDLHRMALILLSENAPKAASILVLGAGGGLELKAFAERRPSWSFVGADPSQKMIDLAREVVGPHDSQIEWVQGYIEDAPLRSFDGATCLLVLHFLSRAERLRVLRELRARLKPGAPLIVAHHSSPETANVERWLTRSVIFAGGEQADIAQAENSASYMAKNLSLLPAEDEEALLQQAGFSAPSLFYAGFSFRGWVCFADKA